MGTLDLKAQPMARGGGAESRRHRANSGRVDAGDPRRALQLHPRLHHAGTLVRLAGRRA